MLNYDTIIVQHNSTFLLLVGNNKQTTEYFNRDCGDHPGKPMVVSYPYGEKTFVKEWRGNEVHLISDGEGLDFFFNFVLKLKFWIP